MRVQIGKVEKPKRAPRPTRRLIVLKKIEMRCPCARVNRHQPPLENTLEDPGQSLGTDRNVYTGLLEEHQSE
jgi:hypothetical protein